MPYRFPTTAAQRSLAARFALPYSDQMQDWEYEVADPQRFGEFLSTYGSPDLTEDERFSLMEILIQCAEEIEPEVAHRTAWAAIEPLLLANRRIHESTIEYWARLGETEPESYFRVSLEMRRLWSVIAS